MPRPLALSAPASAALPVCARWRAHGALVVVVVGLAASSASGQAGCAYEWAIGAPYPGVNNDTLYDMIGWDPDGPGPAGEQVIMSGNFPVAGNLIVPGIAGWTGSEYRPFSPMPADGRGEFTGMGTYDPDGAGPLPERLYATRNPAYTLDVWDGLSWSPVAAVAPIGVGGSFQPQVRLLQFDPDGEGPRNPLLIVAGTGTVGSGLSTDRIVAYDGASTFALGPGAGFDGNVFGLRLFDPDGPGPAKADLIVWGQFSNFSGVPMMQVARYDGTSFHAMGAGLGTNDANFDERVYDVIPYDADGDGPGLPLLIATGQFVSSGATPISGIAVWDGAAWQPFGAGITGSFFPQGKALGVAPKIGLATNANDLLVGGQFSAVNGVAAPNLARFDGAAWSAVVDTQTGVSNPGGTVHKIVVYDPDGAGPQQRRAAIWGQAISNPSRGALKAVEYDLGMQRYRAMANITGVNAPSNLTVYDSDGPGAAPPRVILGRGTLISPTGAQADASLFDGRNFVQMPANACASGKSVTVWDADGVGPSNPVAVFARVPNNNSCGFQAWDGAAWSTLPGAPFPRAPVFDDPPMRLTTWDPDGSGVLTPRLIATTYLPYSNGAALGGIAQYDGVSWGPIGTGFSAGRVWALTTWDRDNSGVRRLVAVGSDDLASNGVPVTGVAVFDGSNWVPVGNIAPFNDPGRPFLTVTSWDRDGPGGLPEVLVVGRMFSTFVFDGSAWTLQEAASRQVMSSLSTWDRDDSGPEAPLLTVCSDQVAANGGGFAAFDALFGVVQYSGYDVRAAVPFDPDGAGPAPQMLCAGGRFNFINDNLGGGGGVVVSNNFARFDLFTDLWAAPVGGVFDDPTRWECGTAPRALNSVVFDGFESGYTPGIYTVTLPAGGGGVQAERVRVRTDSVTLNLNGRTFQTTEQGTFVDPALVVGEIADTPASLNITNSGAPADLDVGTISIGQTRGTTPAVQQVSLRSANARLLVSGDSLIGHRASASSLSLTNGADAVLSGGVSIGDQPQSAGTLSVAGAGATLLHSAAGESLAVGLRGTGTLQIGGLAGGEAGAIAGSIGRMDVLSIGSLAGGIGLASVAGTETAWSVDSSTFAVGYGGQGTLTVQQGGLLATDTSDLLAIAAYPGSIGFVSLRDAGTVWEESNAVLTIGNRGTLSVGSGAAFRGPGVHLRTGGRLTGSGTVAAPLVRGSPTVVVNAGEIDPESDAGAPPQGPVATLTIEGDLVQSTDAGSAGGIVAFDVAGPAPNQTDQVVVTGNANMGGGLVLKLANGYTPEPGSITNLNLLSAQTVTPGRDRFDVAYFPGLPAQPDGRVPFFRLDYGDPGRTGYGVGVSLDTLTPPGFNDPASFGVPGGPTSAAISDLNGDGFSDLALTVPDNADPTGANGSVVVLFNAGVTGANWNGFGAQATVTVGRNPNGIAIARFRGPGNPAEIAVANTADGSVMRIASTGGVTPLFSIAGTLNNVGVNPVSLVAGDFNNDGTVDLAVANSGVVGLDPGNARVLPNSGSGVFSNGAVLATGFNPVSIAAARINSDGFDDLITANSQSASISVFLRDATTAALIAGSDFLPPRTHPTSPQPVHIVPGGLGNPKDLDNDVAVACLPPGETGTVDVLTNTQTGTGDLAPSVPLPVGDGTRSLAILDMDNDDDNDIAVVADGTGPNAGSSVVRVLRNDTANAGSGQLTFALQPGELLANNPTLIRAADMNNDGQADLVTINSTTGTLAARPGEPGPGEAGTHAERGSREPGDPDRTILPVAVIRTVATPPSCPGDLNGDKAVNTADLVAFLGRFGSSVPAYTNGDLNGDGLVNTADLVQLLGRFGLACG